TTVTGSPGSPLRTSANTIGSPSGSTHPSSTGTEIVPPAANCGLGHSCTQPSTGHHAGGEFTPSGTTVSTTGTDADRAAPSDTAYVNEVEPDVADTRTATCWSSPTRPSSPKPGSLRPPAIDSGSIDRTSFLLGS